MALALAIETSNPSADSGAGVALGEIANGAVNPVDSEPVRRADRHSDDLMPAIDRLTRRAGVAPDQLALVCVSAGPGGYTGLRIAVVVAQAIAERAGGACIGVPTELVVARRVPAGSGFGVCLASKGSTVFARPFGADCRPTGEGRVMDAGSLAELGVDRLVADAFLPDIARQAWDGRLVAPIFDPIAVLEQAALMDADEPARLRGDLPARAGRGDAVATPAWGSLRPPPPGRSIVDKY